ncbi:MAG: DNA replication protein [Alphaproteobacteria bacterium]|nr:DNA replication protein [Alphaproteobacteria bacterium]
MTDQLAFHLDLRPAFGREDFLVAAANRDAVGWIDRWPDWPTPALAVHGPVGCGKTHIVHVWCGASGARLVDAGGAETPIQAVNRTGGLLAVDGADRAPDLWLLHLLNLVTEQKGSLLLTGETPPAQWPFALPDLRSRLRALPAVAVHEPDETLFAAVLLKNFSERQLQVGEDVINFLALRIDRSFASARTCVEWLDRRALEARRSITVPFVANLLATERRDFSRAKQ